MYKLFATKEDVIKEFSKYQIGDKVYNCNGKTGDKGYLQAGSKLLIINVTPNFDYHGIQKNELSFYELRDKKEYGFIYTAEFYSEEGNIQDVFAFFGNEITTISRITWEDKKKTNVCDILYAILIIIGFIAIPTLLICFFCGIANTWFGYSITGIMVLTVVLFGVVNYFENYYPKPKLKRRYKG